MAFPPGAQRKGREAQKAKAATALAKQKEVLPAVAQLRDQQALQVISHVAEHGDILAASKSLGVSEQRMGFADVILFLRSKPEWVNALEVAEATYAKKLSRDAVDVANEPIPWAEIQGWDLDGQKLYLDAWAKRQKLRVDTMRGMAASLVPKVPGTAVSVSVDASRREPAGAYATMLQAVEQHERTAKVIEHKEG